MNAHEELKSVCEYLKDAIAEAEYWKGIDRNPNVTVSVTQIKSAISHMERIAKSLEKK